uniref:Uncharacterized protein n=1 Tax=Pararge aegeria TaxID=116150 RepID=S4PTP8_9NEOP
MPNSPETCVLIIKVKKMVLTECSINCISIPILITCGCSQIIGIVFIKWSWMPINEVRNYLYHVLPGKIQHFMGVTCQNCHPKLHKA